MAQTVIDSNVMREKAKTIENSAERIRALYDEMLQEVNSTAGKMKGETIEAQKERFSKMKERFETFVADMNAYSKFLIDAAEHYEEMERIKAEEAVELGNIF